MLYGSLLAFLLMQPLVNNLTGKWNLKRNGSLTVEKAEQTTAVSSPKNSQD